MHPDTVFHETDAAAMRVWAARRGFAHIFAGTPEGSMVAHAPVTAAGADALRFHVARGNRIARHLDGAAVLLSLGDVDGYVSPSWYEDAWSPTEVPTWNYVTVEVSGRAHRLDPAALTAHLDALAATHEPRVSPGLPWTRAKTDPAYFDKLLAAVIGFEVTVESVRGTTKLSQHRSAVHRASVADALERSGNAPLAQGMRA